MHRRQLILSGLAATAGASGLSACATGPAADPNYPIASDRQASAYTADDIGGEDQFDGYVYGAGVDYKVTENIVVGGEVLQHEFEDLGATDLETTTAAARVSYQF